MTVSLCQTLSLCQACYKHRSGCEYYDRYVEQNRKIRDVLKDFNDDDFKISRWVGLRCKHFCRNSEVSKIKE